MAALKQHLERPRMFVDEFEMLYAHSAYSKLGLSL